MLVPLRSRGRTLGVLVALDRRAGDGSFSADEELLLTSFSASAAAAIAATEAMQEELRRRSVAASERERQRWARELHDETLQELGALRGDAGERRAPRADRRDAARRGAGDEQVQRVIAGLSGLITELRPAALDQLGAGPALETLAERVHAREGLEIEMDVDLGSSRNPHPSASHRTSRRRSTASSRRRSTTSPSTPRPRAPGSRSRSATA